MRPTFSLLLLFAILFFPAAATAQVRELPLGENFNWSYEAHTDPIRVRSGDVMMAMEGRQDPESPEMVALQLTVTMPGMAPVTVEGAAVWPSMEHRVTVGRWDSRRSYVLLQSFTGGAHCCNEVTLIVPEGGALQAIALGTWDGDYMETLPTDLNGDGVLDFVFADNAFLYRFSSYADNYAPPQIMNVVDAEAVDVSDEPGFRPLFEQARQEARQLCLDAQNGAPNGACAAYVAAAARVGRFDEAWAEMQRAHDRTSDWGLEGVCRIPQAEGDCPVGQSQDFADFPAALRYFLVENGYIPR
jgi:hypothetical protein